MKKHLCIHGHFYQPPRENPWLNTVEIQESAYPYHDWNERINAECYDRNAASRILDDEGKVVDIFSNYAWMSFNIGPTLLQWMEAEAPETYRAILEADQKGREHFNGHGPALAQAYNHIIMPLANLRDKHTQVKWGIADFRHRYGRPPEGMWLGETAANTETLEVLAEHGIKFTILSPYQAKSFRKMGDDDWEDGTDAKIDPRRAYRCNLPSGHSISLFFYDGPASQGVAFEGLLDNGEKFADRLLEVFDENPEEPQLAHIATDGESYGHHHKKGEMALSYCLHTLRESEEVKLTIYGEYLENHPPEWEAEIIEDTSWSCAHGVERWRSDCGCHTGGHDDWHQKWRAPLRESFDWVRGELEELFETEMADFTDQPWEARDAYIMVILDRSEANVRAFLEEHFGESLNKEAQVKLLQLLEMQYHAMLMYTSCGWFFDEVTGIETMQDILYAARALQLAQAVSGRDFSEDFEEKLTQVPTNMPEFESAADAYRKYVKPTVVDMLRVGAHYAVASLFQDFPSEAMLYSFDAQSKLRRYFEAGKQKLVIGRAVLKSAITWEEIDVSYAVLHLGEHHLFGGVREYIGDQELAELEENMRESFDHSRVYEIFNLMDKHFGNHSYSFWHLFKDDQKKIMESVMDANLTSAQASLYQLYQTNFPLMQVYSELSIPVPKALQLPVELALNHRLGELLEAEKPALAELQKTVDAMRRAQTELDTLTLHFQADQRLAELIARLADEPENLELLNYTAELLQLLQEGGLRPEYRQAQNLAFRLKNETYQNRCANGTETDHEWCYQFEKLYQRLNLKL